MPAGSKNSLLKWELSWAAGWSYVSSLKKLLGLGIFPEAEQILSIAESKTRKFQEVVSLSLQGQVMSWLGIFLTQTTSSFCSRCDSKWCIPSDISLLFFFLVSFLKSLQVASVVDQPAWWPPWEAGSPPSAWLSPDGRPSSPGPSTWRSADASRSQAPPPGRNKCNESDGWTTWTLDKKII